MYQNLLSTLSKKINQYFSEIEASYGFDYGPEFEMSLCKLLQELLPTKYGICRGFIVDKTGAQEGDDIIIYDRLKYPTLRLLGDNLAQKERIPFEAVYCYIEAKHNLELDPTDDTTLTTALKQIGAVRRLKRDDRPLSQVTEVCSVSGKIDRPLNWTSILNPLYTCIISRKTSLKTEIDSTLKKGPVDRSSTYKLLNARRIDANSIPDLIVAGEGVLVLPAIGTNPSEIELTPLCVERDRLYLHPQETSENALAIGLCHMLWALDRIQLGSMPWEEIIVNAIKKF